MANLWFTPSGAPVTLSRGASSAIRSEFNSLSAGFDMMPTPAQVWGNAAQYGVAAGSVNAWTVSIAATYLTSYVDGMAVRVKFPATNTTTTPTINLNSLGAKTITLDGGSAVAAGDIAANAIVGLIYNGTTGKFQMAQSSIASADAAASATAQAVIATTQAGIATTAAAAAAASSTGLTEFFKRVYLKGY